MPALLHVVDSRSAFSLEHGAAHGDVAELPAFACCAQEKTASAHVAAADKIFRKQQSIAEAFEQDVPIFGRCDATEKNGGAVCGQLAGENGGVAAQWLQVARIGAVDINRAEGAKFICGKFQLGIEQTPVGGDHPDNLFSIMWCEPQCIGKFAAEIEPTGESENLPKREALAMELVREREGSRRVEAHAGAGAGDLCRRDQEDALHRTFDRRDGRRFWAVNGGYFPRVEPVG